MDLIGSINYKKILKFSNSNGYKITSRESNFIEFKESFNWGSKDKYSKSAAGFSNNKGGYIIFGVKDQPRELVGLQTNNFENIDEASIAQYLNGTFSPEIQFEKFTGEIRGKKIGVLYIHQSEQKPIVAIKPDGEIKEAEIYYRYNGRTDKIKFPELQNILSKIREDEKKNWMRLFEKISQIGPQNTALIDMVKGKIEGKTGNLVIDHKLIPKIKFIQEGNFKEKGHPTLKLIGEVKPISVINGKYPFDNKNITITDDPKAIAVREETILIKYPLSYAKLIEALNSRYVDFKITRKFYDLKKKLMSNQKFCHSRYLDPSNPKGTKKDFYSQAILREFDIYYTIKGGKK
jgi:hypothetical protein